MRVAPIGLLYSDEAAIKAIGEASAISTHGSEPAARAGHLGALAIRMALDGRSGEDIMFLLIEEMNRLATPETEKLARLLATVPGAVHKTIEGVETPWEVMDHGKDKLGQSWVADEALASALYCVCLAEARGEGYVETVRYGANTPGDSDSIACIAGGIAGALWGIGGRGVPSEWINRIEKSAYLGTLADRLADASASIK
jgi:ADP-ribosylglycohydrolase